LDRARAVSGRPLGSPSSTTRTAPSSRKANHSTANATGSVPASRSALAAWLSLLASCGEFHSSLLHPLEVSATVETWLLTEATTERQHTRRHRGEASTLAGLAETLCAFL